MSDQQSSAWNQPWSQQNHEQVEAAASDTPVTQNAHRAHSGPVGAAPEASLGPFDTRDVVVLISVVLIFLGSLLPLTITRLRVGNLWNTDGLFFLGVGILLPLLLGVLTVLRRVKQQENRIGSLTLNQFGSVVASLAFAYYFLNVVTNFGWAYSVGLVGSMGLMLATVCASWAPGLFSPASPASGPGAAHGHAPVAPWASPYHQEDQAHQGAASQGSVLRDSGPQRAGPQQSAAQESAFQDAAVQAPVDTMASTYAEPLSGQHPDSEPASEPGPGSTPDPTSAAVAGANGLAGASESEPTTVAPEQIVATAGSSAVEYRAFWFAVDTPRSAVDESSGMVQYLVEPGIWFLALEDRGHEFLVQSQDGLIAVLRDLRNVERAPEEQ
ncbi:hypothetical protein [Acaricomes phytoseiuli]|uniref:hypothetical protein n=1 Tax=Acaricomes phytoseiuli TaxID=291968 RepID=UPI0003651BC1|nr:hypothetical protein [Acaricomes phytoseiuli]